MATDLNLLNPLKLQVPDEDIIGDEEEEESELEGEKSEDEDNDEKEEGDYLE